MYKKLNLNHESRTNISIMDIGHTVNKIQTRAELKIKSIHTNFTSNLDFLVINEITACIPSVKFNVSEIKIPNDILLADEHFYTCRKIDILLGAEVFFDLLLTEHVSLGKNKPTFRRTHLGWIVTGQIIQNNVTQRGSCNIGTYQPY